MTQLIDDVRLLVKPGLLRGFPRMDVLPTLPVVAETATSGTDSARQSALRAVTERALREIGERDPVVGRALRALLHLGAEREPLGERRAKAGEIVGYGVTKVRTELETLWLQQLADQLQQLQLEDRFRGASTLSSDATTYAFEFPIIRQRITEWYRVIERECRPDLVITMSGPGAIVPLLVMAVSARPVPVIVCPTFPNPESSTMEEQWFARNVAGRWRRLETTKWIVYLPGILFELEPGSRVLLIDDRVHGGRTQRTVQRLLREQSGAECFRSALIAPTSHDLDIPPQIVTDADYILPWGSRRGRQ